MTFFGALFGISFVTAVAFRNGISALVGVAGIVAVSSYWLMRAYANRALLRNGELAVGRVVYQQTMPGNRYQSARSVIFYAFVDSANRGFIGQGTDLTDSLTGGAPIAVYYDRLSPSKNIAAESSRLRVKTT